MARSAYRDASTRTDHERPSTSGSDRKELWSNLLDNVASGKKIPEKNLIVLGGTSETQKEFLDSLQQDSPTRLRPPDRSRVRKTPIANKFALGYTYQDVYDSDHEDIVARLSSYTISSPSPAYAPLLARLLTPQTIPSTAVAILLDWCKPWTFVRTLRSWIRLLNTVAHSLPAESKYALEENTTAWQHARDTALATSLTDGHTSMPLGPGEYDEPLGLPLVVVCQNALAVEALEKERGYRESHFDYILQFLRTVLLKHGAGLIYTMPSQPGQLQPLIHSLLGIQSAGIAVTGKEKSERLLKHNVVDRERVLVPPAWDSWGKIRVLREGFDVEGISRAWGVEIQNFPIQKSDSGALDQNAASNIDQDDNNNNNNNNNNNTSEPDAVLGVTDIDEEQEEESDDSESDTTALLYEQTIQDPHPQSNSAPAIDVPCTPDQHFFAAQLDRLEAYRAEDEAAKKAASARRATASGAGASVGGAEDSITSRAMTEHIGPVQFNMGGIQYDADEALKRIKERNKPPSSTTNQTTAAAAAAANSSSTPDRKRAPSQSQSTSTPTTLFSPGSPPNVADVGAKDIPTENLEAYFASLMKKGQRGSSAANSPRPRGGEI